MENTALHPLHSLPPLKNPSAGSLPRKALNVAFALVVIELRYGKRGATYEGLRVFLGLRSSSAIRDAVRCARGYGLVLVAQAGGAGGKTVIRLSQQGRAISPD